MLGRAVLKNPWLIRQIWDDMRGIKADPHTRREHQAFLLAHFDRHVVHYGEKAGAILFRKWIPQYARDLRIPRPVMVAMLQIKHTKEMRQAFEALPV